MEEPTDDPLGKLGPPAAERNQHDVKGAMRRLQNFVKKRQYLSKLSEQEVRDPRLASAAENPQIVVQHANAGPLLQKWRTQESGMYNTLFKDSEVQTEVLDFADFMDSTMEDVKKLATHFGGHSAALMPLGSDEERAVTSEALNSVPLIALKNLYALSAWQKEEMQRLKEQNELHEVEKERDQEVLKLTIDRLEREREGASVSLGNDELPLPPQEKRDDATSRRHSSSTTTTNVDYLPSMSHFLSGGVDGFRTPTSSSPTPSAMGYIRTAPPKKEAKKEMINTATQTAPSEKKSAFPRSIPRKSITKKNSIRKTEEDVEKEKEKEKEKETPPSEAPPLLEMQVNGDCIDLEDDLSVTEIEERYKATRSMHNIQERIQSMLSSVKNKGKQVMILKFMVARTEEFLSSIQRREEATTKKLRQQIEVLQKRVRQLGEDEEFASADPDEQFIRIKLSEHDAIVQMCDGFKKQSAENASEVRRMADAQQRLRNDMQNLRCERETLMSMRNEVLRESIFIFEHAQSVWCPAQDGPSAVFPGTDKCQGVVILLAQYLSSLPEKMKCNSDLMEEQSSGEIEFEDLSAESRRVAKQLALAQNLTPIALDSEAKREPILGYIYSRVVAAMREIFIMTEHPKCNTPNIHNPREFERNLDNLTITDEVVEICSADFFLEEDTVPCRQKFAGILEKGRLHNIFKGGFVKFIGMFTELQYWLRETYLPWVKEATRPITPIKPPEMVDMGCDPGDVGEVVTTLQCVASHACQTEEVFISEEAPVEPEVPTLMEDNQHYSNEVRILAKAKREIVEAEDFSSANVLKWQLDTLLGGGGSEGEKGATHRHSLSHTTEACKRRATENFLGAHFSPEQLQVYTREGMIALEAALEPCYTQKGRQMTLNFCTHVINSMGVRYIRESEEEEGDDFDLPSVDSPVSEKLLFKDRLLRLGARCGWLKLKEHRARKATHHMGLFCTQLPRDVSTVTMWWANINTYNTCLFKHLRVLRERREVLHTKLAMHLDHTKRRVTKIEDWVGEAVKGAPERSTQRLQLELIQDLCALLIPQANEFEKMVDELSIAEEANAATEACFTRCAAVVRMAKAQQREDKKEENEMIEGEKDVVRNLYRNKFIPKRNVAQQTDEVAKTTIIISNDTTTNNNNNSSTNLFAESKEKPKPARQQHSRWAASKNKSPEHLPSVQKGVKKTAASTHPQSFPNNLLADADIPVHPHLDLPFSSLTLAGVTQNTINTTTALIPHTPQPQQKRPPQRKTVVPLELAVQEPLTGCAPQLAAREERGETSPDHKEERHCANCTVILEERETQRSRERGFSWLPDTDVYRFEHEDVIPCMVRGCSSNLKWVAKLRLELYSSDGRCSAEQQEKLIEALSGHDHIPVKVTTKSERLAIEDKKRVEEKQHTKPKKAPRRR